MEALYEEIKPNGSLNVNRTKKNVYSPNINYEGKPQEFQSGSVTAKLPNHLNGEPTGITVE